MDLQQFRHPDKQFRPSPFWAWNGKLEPEEIRRQIRGMKQQGYGGFFMHSRIGLITPYLSEAWMENVQAAITESKLLDMEAWFYDEDKWPSGFAGGEVPQQGEHMQRKWLNAKWSLTMPEDAAADPLTLGVYAVSLDGEGRVSRFNRIERKPAGQQLFFNGALDEKLSGFLHVFYEHEPDNAWFNGGTYVDLLNPEVTDAFIQSTHNKYAERFGDQFGEHAPGIFTDEPQVGHWPHYAPWTPGLEKLCLEWNGIDLCDSLALLVLDGAGDAEIRYAYWKTVLRRFIEAFSKPLGSWCRNMAGS